MELTSGQVWLLSSQVEDNTVTVTLGGSMQREKGYTGGVHWKISSRCGLRHQLPPTPLWPPARAADWTGPRSEAASCLSGALVFTKAAQARTPQPQSAQVLGSSQKQGTWGKLLTSLPERGGEEALNSQPLLPGYRSTEKQVKPSRSPPS